jgi:hypothetical protein
LNRLFRRGGSSRAADRPKCAGARRSFRTFSTVAAQGVKVKSLTKVIAGTTGLAAFAIATAAGLAAGNAASDVLLRAVGAMIVCHLVGLVVGVVGERTLDEYVRSYYAARPSPRERSLEGSGDKFEVTVDKSVVASGGG